MGANSLSVAGKVAAPVGGAALGLMMQNYHGAPLWMTCLAITVCLAFGIVSSVGRSKDRSEALRVSKVNAGVLWTMACVAVFKGGLDVPTAMITALLLGLVGSPAIEQLEKRWGV